MAKYIDDCMWSDLLSWRDMWFWWLSLSTKAVVVGLLGEAPELYCDISSILKGWNFRRKFRFSLPEGHAANWVKVVAFIGWILIVVGVAGEWESEIRVGDADANLQDFISVNLAEAQKDAARAIEFASINELEAAQLRKDAEELKTENLKLEELIQPRSFTPAEEKRIIAACVPFAGHTVKLRSQPFDIEGAVFASLLAQVLAKTKLRLIADVGNNFMLNIPMTFDVHITGPENEQDLVKALAKSIATRRIIVAPLKAPTPGGSITSILVGAKRLTPKSN